MGSMRFVLHVLHLVGGDDDAGLVVGAAAEHATQVGLGGDVQSVGGFVEQQVVGAEAEGHGQQRFLLLTERHLFELATGVDVQLFHQCLERLVVGLRVEGGQLLQVALGGLVVRQFDGVGQQEDLLQHLGMAVEGVEPVDGAGALLRFLQSHDDFQQCGLAHTVLAQQSVYHTLVETQVDVVEHGRPFVTEVKMSDFYHDCLILMFLSIVFCSFFPKGCKLDY